MARTTRTPAVLAQPSVLITPWQVDSANGEQFAYGGGRNKLVVQVAATPVTVTVKATLGGLLPDGVAIPDKTVVVGANTTRVVWEASTELQADGNVYVDYSATAATILAFVVQG